MFDLMGNLAARARDRAASDALFQRDPKSEATPRSGCGAHEIHAHDANERRAAANAAFEAAPTSPHEALRRSSIVRAAPTVTVSDGPLSQGLRAKAVHNGGWLAMETQRRVDELCRPRLAMTMGAIDPAGDAA